MDTVGNVVYSIEGLKFAYGTHEVIKDLSGQYWPKNQ